MLKEKQQYINVLVSAPGCERWRKGPHLAPLADAPLGARLVVARLRHQPLVLAALSVHQPPAQVVHAVGLSAAAAAATGLGALRARKNASVSKCHYCVTALRAVTG